MMVDNQGLSKFPEYQYHLKDHLGNVRLTFSASPETESNTATLETVHEEEEYATFLRYDETTKINSAFFDHTNNGDTHYAVRLNGSEHERIGLAKSLAVMTGDTIKAEVYAKYLDPDPSNWTAALQNLMAAIAGGTAPTGTVIEAVPPSGGDGFPFEGLLDGMKANDTGTRAYLNILLFDESLTFLEAAYVPVTDAAKENGTNVPHEKLAEEVVVQQPGYAYIYLSNDNEQPLEVFFDDFTVEHAHSAIVQADDYYPFGLTFNSYKRENSVKNKWKFQGQEHIEDFGLNWVSFKWRNHQPDIGRFFNIDPLAESYVHNSPYAFSENKVTGHIELEGLEAVPAPRPGTRTSPRGGGNLSNIRRTVSEAASINRLRPGMAILSRREGAMFRERRTYATSRGNGTSSLETSLAAGTNENPDNTHTFGNRVGNASKVAGRLLEEINTIVETRSFTEAGVGVVSLGSDYLVGDMETTAQFQELQGEWEAGMMDIARGDLSAEKFSNLSADEQSMRINMASAISPPSPLTQVQQQTQDAELVEIKREYKTAIRQGL